MLSSLFHDYNLTVLLESIRKKLVWIILAALLASGGTYFYVSAKNVDMYTSSESLYVTRIGTDSDTNSSGTSGNNAEFGSSSTLASTYKVVLTEKAVAEMVNKNLERYSKSPEQIMSAVSIDIVDNTQLIKISATTSDPNLSYDICMAYSQAAPKVLEDILNGGSVKLVTSPTVATNPNSVAYSTYAVYGAIVGALIALVVIIVMFLFDNTMKSSDEITSKYGIKVWAEVPSFGKRVKKKERNINVEDSRSKVLNNETPFLVIESYKVARTNMAHALATIAPDRGCAVVITSFEPSAGKSLTSANLAITMAKRDRKVLLVDADMRKPMQHKLFAISNDRGLSSVLSGRYTPAECIFKLQGNLHIMPCGPIPANPSELMDSSVMGELINAVRQVYDYIIIDTPPIGVVTDASALASKTDGVVLVARQKSTSSTELSRAVETLKKVDVPILGAIFTDVSGYSKTYGKYRYKNGYKYRYKYRYDHYEYKEYKEDKGTSASSKGKPKAEKPDKKQSKNNPKS